MLSLSLALGVISRPLPGADQPSAADTAAEIKRLEGELARAVVDNDVATLRRIEAETYAYTDAVGKTSTREDFIRDYASGKGRVQSLHYDDLKVEPYGDAAVVRGRLLVERRDGNKTLSRVARYTRFYVRLEGRWQAVAGHSSEPRTTTP